MWTNDQVLCISSLPMPNLNGATSNNEGKPLPTTANFENQGVSK